MMEDRVAFFKEQTRSTLGGIAIAVLSGLAYCASAWVVRSYPRDSPHRAYSELSILLWLVGPPLFFLAEYSIIGRRSEERLPSVERFKYSQDLAAKFWLAGLALLVFLYEGKLP